MTFIASRRTVDRSCDEGSAIFSDITTSNLTEPAQLRHLLQYQAILDNASVGITFTRKGVFLHCNGRFSDMFGWPREELVGLQSSTVFPSEGAYEDLRNAARPVLRLQDGADAGTLRGCADAAMYCAKRAGRGSFQLFLPDMAARARLPA